MNSFFTKIEFVKSATKKEEFLLDKNVITFLGRSNVGKSSLINALISEKNFMKVSKTPGRTIYVNYALVNNKFYLTDVPGYGYATKDSSSFPKLMEDFLTNNPKLKKIYLLLDSRRELTSDEEEFLRYLLSLNIPLKIIFTKYDKLNTSEKNKLNKEIEYIKSLKVDYFLSSISNNQLLDKIRKDILS